MEDLLESNQTWKAFLIDYYQPYIHKINIELGGYHPKTKKETKVEDDELIMFYNQKNKEIEDAKPESQSYSSSWNSKDADYDMPGDYDYCFEDDLNLSLSLIKEEKEKQEKENQEKEKQEKEKEKQENDNKEKENKEFAANHYHNENNNNNNDHKMDVKVNGFFKIEEKIPIIEREPIKNVVQFTSYGKCRYEYEDYDYFD